MKLKGMTRAEIEKIEKKQAVEQQIAELKSFLQQTDYVIIKQLEGYEMTESYKKIIAERKAARDKINMLERE
mgnify:FL=1